MRNILSYIGVLMFIAGVSLVIPIPAAVILGELDMIFPFAISAALALGMGYALTRVKKTELDLRTAFIVTALGWLVVTLFGSLPFIIALNASFIDGYFEAMSGFTTTGMSVFVPEDLPRTIIFWRSLTEWIGGIGIVVVLLVVMARENIASKMYMAEARTDRIEPSIVETAQRIFYIYMYFTLVGILLLYLAGSSVFDAVNHTLSSLPTGGFSPHNDSYGSMAPLIKAITMLLMMAGGISFAVHQRWMNRDLRSLYTNLEVRALVGMVALFGILLYLDGMGPVDAFFQSISAITTSGFASVNIAELSDLSKSYIILLMNIGGGYGATASGIKLVRFIIIVNAVRWFIKKITSPPRVVLPFKIQNRVFTDDEVFTVLLFTILYLTFLVPSILIFIWLGNSFLDSVFMICSAQGNNGLVTLTTYTSIEKVIMIFHMWIGRLEIIPALVLLTSFKRGSS